MTFMIFLYIENYLLLYKLSNINISKIINISKRKRKNKFNSNNV